MADMFALLASAFVGGGLGAGLLNHFSSKSLQRQQSDLAREAVRQERQAEMVESALPDAWAAFERAKRAADNVAEADLVVEEYMVLGEGRMEARPIPPEATEDFFEAFGELRAVRLHVPEPLYNRMDETLRSLHDIAIQAYYATAGMQHEEAVKALLAQFDYQEKKRTLEEETTAIERDVRQLLGTLTKDAAM